MKPYLDAADIAEWQAYARIEPFGATHTEVLIAQAACAICRSMGAKNINVEDFMPSYVPPEQDWRDIHRAVENLKLWRSSNS